MSRPAWRDVTRTAENMFARGPAVLPCAMQYWAYAWITHGAISPTDARNSPSCLAKRKRPVVSNRLFCCVAKLPPAFLLLTAQLCTAFDIMLMSYLPAVTRSFTHVRLRGRRTRPLSR